MLLGKSTKSLLLLSSLLVTSAAFAAPTVSNYSNNLLAPALSANAAARVLGLETNQTSELYIPHLATIAGELLKPPAIANLPASPIDSIGIAAKPLPPLPAAVFLVFTGFLCVSLVKDRKIWLAALAGLLWLSHTGLTTLPKFASHIISKKQIQHSAAGGLSLFYVSQLDGSFRPRSELEGSEYIGLLRHLAGIPDTTMPPPLSSLSLRGVTPLAGRQSNLNLNSPKNHFASAQSKYKFRLPQLAINLFIPHSIRPYNCLASGAKQILPNFPAFLSLRLARGPPQKIRESSLLYM
jgi:hypothetical protein